MPEPTEPSANSPSPPQITGKISSVWYNEDVIQGEVRLPAREFMYTLDQVAYMLDCTMNALQPQLYYKGRSGGSPRGRISVVNIAPRENKPNWRISESALVNWLKIKDITFTTGRSTTKQKRKV